MISPATARTYRRADCVCHQAPQPCQLCAMAPQPPGHKLGITLSATNIAVATHTPPPRNTLLIIVDEQEDCRGFWFARESLAHIRESALQTMAPPWATLGHCAARALATVPPRVGLPPLGGEPGSLNWFALNVARSGGGKGLATKAGRRLVPAAHIRRGNLGSGEGFLDAYRRPPDKLNDDPGGWYESILFLEDESDTVAALAGRAAQTLTSTLRKAFMGEDIGFGYRGRNDDRLQEHTYRCALVMSTQPARAGWILDDADGGTPQRFMWFAANDPDISRDRYTPNLVQPLTLPNPAHYPDVITVPKVCLDAVLDNAEARGRGDADALDAHALFCQEKLAFALAVLDGRTYMTEEDWELSEFVVDHSDTIRGRVIEDAEDAKVREARQAGQLRAASQIAAGTARYQEEEIRVGHVAKRVLRIVGQCGSDGIKRRDLQNRLHSSERRWLGEALLALFADGVVMNDGGS